MNRIYATIYSALIVLLFNQQSFCMEQLQQLAVFDGFSHLAPELQIIIMRYSYNQANIQSTNKYWAEKVSIKTPGAITDAFCIDHPQRVTQILLHAAYVKNYKGVENIVKNSCFLTQNSRPHVCIDIYNNQPYVLDLHGIAWWEQDQHIDILLNKYKISKFNPVQIIMPTRLMMDCLAGNSDSVFDSASENNYWKQPVDGLTGIQYVLATKENALKIAVDYDHGKCIKALLKNMLVDSNWVTIEENRVNCKTLLTDDILWRAIDKLKLKALEALLATDYFDINKILYRKIKDKRIQYKIEYKLGYTLLDKVKLETVINPHYKSVVSLLKKYGAKTIKKIEKEKEEEKDVAMRSICVIS